MSSTKDYVIVTDSMCDLDTATKANLSIGVIDGYISVEGKDLPSTTDWGKYYTAKEYYDWLREGKSVTSSQVPPEAFVDFFQERLEQGKDILYIGCSSALSNTVNSGKIAATQLKEQYPERKIIVIDSLRASLGLGLMVIKARQLQDEGQSMDEVAQYIEDNKAYVHQVGTVESLMFLKKAGRIKAGAAIMGTLVGVKPIIISDSMGMNVSIEKVIGRKKAYRHCIEYVKETIIDSENQYIYLCHSDCIDIATQIEEMIKESIPCKGVVMGIVNPAMGNSVGPGMFGIYYCGKKVTV